VKITLCQSCALGQSGFASPLAQALQTAGIQAETAMVDCMSGCANASTLAFRAPGKTAYLFGNLTEADLPALVTFASAYSASPNGNFADARFLGSLRTKALARIPG
jgi:predicted metal-binding protein